MTEQAQNGWCPLTGQRVFKSANQAWEIYGKYRFALSKRTFLTFVGTQKACPPRHDGCLYVEDIEIIGKTRAWAPTPSFVRGAPKGGEGEAPPEGDIGYEIQMEKLLKARLEREDFELDLAKKRRELLPLKDFEQRLAAAAAIVGNEAETFVYDYTREIIHVCGGNPEKEDSLREFLLEKVRGWLHSFSRGGSYKVTFEDGDEDEEEAEGRQQAAPEESDAEPAEITPEAEGVTDASATDEIN